MFGLQPNKDLIVYILKSDVGNAMYIIGRAGVAKHTLSERKKILSDCLLS